MITAVDGGSGINIGIDDSSSPTSLSHSNVVGTPNDEEEFEGADDNNDKGSSFAETLTKSSVGTCSL